MERRFEVRNAFITRAAFWKTLSKTDKCLLVVGMLIGLPVVVTLIIVAGARLAFKFLTETA